MWRFSCHLNPILPAELFSIIADIYPSVKWSPWGPNTSDFQNFSAYHYLLFSKLQTTSAFTKYIQMTISFTLTFLYYVTKHYFSMKKVSLLGLDTVTPSDPLWMTLLLMMRGEMGDETRAGSQSDITFATENISQTDGNSSCKHFLFIFSHIFCSGLSY